MLLGWFFCGLMVGLGFVFRLLSGVCHIISHLGWVCGRCSQQNPGEEKEKKFQLCSVFCPFCAVVVVSLARCGRLLLGAYWVEIPPRYPFTEVFLKPLSNSLCVSFPLNFARLVSGWVFCRVHIYQLVLPSLVHSFPVSS